MKHPLLVVLVALTVALIALISFAQASEEAPAVAGAAPALEPTSKPVPVPAPAAAPVAQRAAPVRVTEQSAPAPAPAPGPASASVATVDGKPIPLRALEDALLKREGAELVEQLVTSRLDQTDWESLGDDDVILEIAGTRLRRGMLAAQLLRQKAAAVREEMINIAIVENALAAEGIVIGQAEVDAELARMQRKLDRSLEERAGGARMSLADYIGQSQKMPIDEFTRQPGFRIGTGLHLLAERRLRTEATDDLARQWFERNKARYDVAEGVELSLIAIPYEKTEVAGALVVTEAERRHRLEVVQHIRDSIVAGAPFAKAWWAYGRARDPQAAPDGRVGWIGRDGVRPQKGAPPVPKAVVDAAFAAEGQPPILLQPSAGEDGIVLALVHGRRAAKAATFAEVRERVIADIVDEAIEPRTQRLLGELRDAATIDYESLPALIDERARATGLPVGGLDEPVPAEPVVAAADPAADVPAR